MILTQMPFLLTEGLKNSYYSKLNEIVTDVADIYLKILREGGKGSILICDYYRNSKKEGKKRFHQRRCGKRVLSFFL